MKKNNLFKNLLIIAFILISHLAVKAQIAVNVLINPPYPLHLNDYINYGSTLVVTVTNTGTSSEEIYLRGSISGDNGVSITSNPDIIPATFITINAGQTLVLYGNDLEPYFNFNRALITGIDRNLLVSNQALPEGYYTVCVEAYDHRTNELLSDPPGCGFFNVRFIEPSIITSPICGDTIQALNPQTMVFSWTPAIGAPATTQYQLKIAEVFPAERNPYDAIHSATTPPFFEQTVYGYSFVYGPGQPTLEPGKKYAYTITAIDPAGETTFINNGESEVCTFIYGSAPLPIIYFEQEDEVEIISLISTQGYTVSGKLKYYLKSEGQTNSFLMKNMPIELIYAVKTIDYETKKESLYPIDNGSGINSGFITVGTAITDNSGNFTFNFSSMEPLGYFSNNYSFESTVYNNNPTATGDLHKVLMLHVQSEYYCNPKITFDENQIMWGSTFNTGELLSKAKDFSLEFSLNTDGSEDLTAYYMPLYSEQGVEEVSFSQEQTAIFFKTLKDDDPSDNNRDLSQLINSTPNNGIIVDANSAVFEMTDPITLYELNELESNPAIDNRDEFNVDIYRDYVPFGVPDEEGNKEKLNSAENGLEYIFHGVTNDKKIIIPGLIKNIGPADHYILEITPVNQKFDESKMQYQFEFRYIEDPSTSPPWETTDVAFFNEEYITPLVPFESTSKELTSATTVLSGNMKYMFADPGETELYPFKNQPIKLVRQYAIDKGDGNIINIPYAGSADADVTGNLSEITTTTTDDAGNYIFSFSDLTELGLVNENASFTIRDHGYYDQYFNDSGSFSKEEEAYPPHTYQGKLYCYVRILTESDYFTNSETVIELKAGEAKQLNDPIVVNVRSYSLTATISGNGNADEFNKDELEGLVVKLWRTERPFGVPENEGGDIIEESYFDSEKICEGVTNAAGEVTFSRLVKNFGPNDNYVISAYSSDDPSINPKLHYYSMWFENFSWNNTPYGSTIEVDPTAAQSPDKAKWNAEYIYANVKTTFNADALNPSINGYVSRSDNTSNMVGDAALTIKENSVSFATTKTSVSGYYNFSNFPLSENSLSLYSTKSGYQFYVFPGNIPQLKMGQQFIFNFSMSPAAEVKGRVVNEIGEGVLSQINIGDGGNILTDENGYFQGPALSNQNQQIFVDPADPDYFTTTKVVNVNNYLIDAGNIVVLKNQHHIIINLADALSNVPITNATIEIYGTGLSKKTDNNGEVSFAFENAATNFSVIITGPSGKEWFNKPYNIVNNESDVYSTYYLTIEEATQIKGHVYVNGTPLDQAKVFVDITGYKTQSFTDNNGYYILHNVPKRNELMIKAVKSQSDKIGDSISINTITNTADVNFNLTLYKSIDISRLWGFPIEVEHLSETGGKVYITGSFVDLPSNDHFKITDPGEAIHFNKVPIKAGSIKNPNGIGYAIPDGILEITFDETKTIDITLLNTYISLQGDNLFPVKMVGIGGDKGVLKGKVKIDPINFNESTLKFDEVSGLYINAPAITDAVEKMNIKSINPDAANPYVITNGYPITSSTGSAITYQLYDINGTASTSGSFINSEALILNTTVHTQISSLSQADIKAPIGDVIIHPGVPATIEKIIGNTELTLKMNKWNLKSSNWEFNSNGLQFLSGVLEADGLNIPLIKTIDIDYDVIKYATEGTFDLNNLMLINIIPLAVTGKNQFGFDGSNWQLSLTSKGSIPAGHISSLPGMSNDTEINFDFINLKSDGTKKYQTKSTPTNFYEYADFISNAGLLGVTANSITLNGSLDLHIPLLAVQQTTITYKNNGGTISLPELPQFNFSINTNGVIADFMINDKIFNSEGYTCTGKVYETGVFNHKITLIKNKSVCAINTIDGQEFIINPIKNSKLINIKGAMDANLYDTWTPYAFSGDLFGTTGAGGNLVVQVYGDLIVNEGNISLTNIPTPFGDFSLGYDFDIQELTGSLNFIGQISAGLVSLGPISAQVKFGSLGWYFAGTCDVNPINVPISLVAAVVFGDYPVKDDNYIKEIFIKHSVLGALPPGFDKNFSGYYVNGSLSPLAILPDLSFDFFVASGSLNIKYMADFGVGMNFNEATLLHVSQGVKFLLHADAGVSAIVGCAHGGFDAEYTMGLMGDFNNEAGTFTLSGFAQFGVGASLEVGFGCCDSDCGACFDTPAGDSCNNESFNGKVIFKVNASVDSNADLNVDFDIKSVEL